MPYPPEKNKEYMRQYHLKRKAFIEAYKEQNPCLDCGVKYPYYIMEFDHVRGTKVDNINRLRFRRSIKSIQEELDKCEVICANCHRKRTWQRSI